MLKILYICTHNRCRSILSEAITNHYGDGMLKAESAGSQPSGIVHPLSLKYLEQADISIEGLQSQSWDELESFAPDIVVTVCDSAAGETCPVWFGKSVKVHWGLSDPSKVEGTDEQKEQAFNDCIKQIKQRVLQLKALAEEVTSEDTEKLRSALINLGAS